MSREIFLQEDSLITSKTDLKTVFGISSCLTML